MAYPCWQTGYTIPYAMTLQAEYNGGGLQSVTFTAGTHYDSIYDLVQALATKCQAACGGTWTAGIHSSGVSLGKVTIYVAANTLRIVWGTDTTIRDGLGFAGDLTPAAILFTATSAHWGGWYPDDVGALRDIQEGTSSGSRGWRTSSTCCSVATNEPTQPGTMTIRASTPLGQGTGNLVQLYTMIEWLNTVMDGETFALCLDRTDQATHTIYRLGPELTEVSVSSPETAPNQYWTTTIPVWEVAP